MKRCDIETEFKAFIENVRPIKLTESYRMKLNSKSWSIVTDYFLESVKISRHKNNEVTSTAIIKVTDGTQQVICLIRGKKIGLLFGLTEEEWSEIEDLCSCEQQLFYRYFKDGLSKNYNCEQKLFYNFCLSNQKENALVAFIRRTANTRNKDKQDVLLQIVFLRNAQSYVLDLYSNFLLDNL